jgi:hypothetical protein
MAMIGAAIVQARPRLDFSARCRAHFQVVNDGGRIGSSAFG